MVNNLFGFGLEIQPSKNISQYHLRDPDHASPTCVSTQSLNATPITEPNNFIKLYIKELFFLTNFLINMSQQRY